MAEIVGLTHPENVTLIGGAMQYWLDAEETNDWASLLVPEVSGRTLVVGKLPATTLTAIGEAASELHVLVRGIPDAAAVAEAVPTAQVWCGDPSSLRDHTAPFDTVLALVDASVALSLEVAQRGWQAVADDVAALVAPGGTLVTWVENDLGVHRLTQSHNPRAERDDKDWDVMATWDASRPRSIEQVRAAYPDARVRLTWPGARPLALVVNPETMDEDVHCALAARVAISPNAGPDPVYMLSAAAMAGRLDEFAAGWLVTVRPRSAEDSAQAHIAFSDGVQAVGSEVRVEGRPALFVFAELAAAEDLPAIRRLIADWAAAFAGDDAGRLEVDPSFAHSTVQEQDGTWVFTPFVPRSADATAARWEALGELVGFIRGRGWRGPWPAIYTDARILNHLGIMAGMHTVSTARAAHLVPQVSKADPHGAADKQTLASAVDRNTETINTLNSKVRLLEQRLADAEQRAGRGGVLGKGRKAAGKAKQILGSALKR